MSLRILILEDSADDAALVARHLARMNEPSGTRIAVSRMEFERALREERFDLVVADYNLPQFNGLDALRLLQEWDADVPFILVAGTIGEEAAVAVMKAGAGDYVLKHDLIRLPLAAEHAIAEARDRRERFEAAAALRERNRLYRAVVEQAHEGIAILDNNGRILEANRQAYALVGRDPEDAIPELADLFDPADLRDDPFEWTALRRGGTIEKRRRIRRRDGSLVPVDLTAKSVDGAFVVICRDATGRVRAEQEFEKHRAMDAALAELSRLALAATDAQPVFDAAVNLVAETVGADFTTVLEYRPEEGAVVIRAGFGFPPDARVRFDTQTDVMSLSSYTLSLREPVTVEDWATETRCHSAFLTGLGARSSIAMVIDSREGPFGILGTHSRTPRAFGATEALFVRSIANVLGDFVRRFESERDRFRREQEFKAMISDSPDVIARYDRDLRHLYVSRAVTRLTGKEPHEFFGKTNEEAGLPSTLCEAFDREVRAVFADGKSRAFEFDYDDGGGSRFSFHARVVPQLSSAGEIESVLSIASDVSGLKAAEQRLRDSEERYRGLVEHARDAIYTVSLDGRFESINAAGTQITGWSEQELIGTSFTALTHPDDRPMVLGEFLRVLRGDVTSPNVIRVLHKEGHYVRIDTTAAPIVRDGTVGVFGIGRDITERERLTRRIHLLLESTFDGIIADDVEGTCTQVNSAACRILGLEPDQIVGRNVHELVHMRGSGSIAHTREECPLRSAAITRKPLQLADEVFQRAGGATFPAEVSVSPMVEDGTLLGTVITFRDVTDKRAMQTELERANRLTSLGRLAATMAHEFNNVLMGIQPFAEIIQRTAINESQTRATKQILRSLQRGRGVTGDILRFTRRAEPTTRPLDLRAWLDELLPELNTIIQPGVTIRLDANDASLVLDADEAQLAQVLTNLVGNARDAMPKGGEIVISMRRCGIGERFRFGSIPAPHRHAHLSIRDTGQGIPPEALGNVFEPFFTTKRKGTGLGLAVAAQIVAAHDGRIFVESEAGHGTTFHLFLPLAEDAAASVRLQAESGREAFPRSVLIVEDDEDVAAGLSALLRDLGVATRLAPTGRDAIEELAREVPDAVILDVRLPDISGTEVYAEIDRRFPRLPVLFSTGHANARELEHILSKNHVAFLMKPYEGDALVQALRETCSAQPEPAVEASAS